MSSALWSLYLYCSNYTYTDFAGENNISRQYASAFVNEILDKINYIDTDELYGKLGLGLNNSIVEADETHLISRRDGRGRILKGERYLVIGGICRITKSCRLKLTRNKKK
ncbi:hypothetical protein COBT_002741 [Conglomerata obtusa]